MAALIVFVALGGLPGLGAVTRALQAGDIFSPASGHAQVIAQGVAPLSGDVAWRVVFHSIDPSSPIDAATSNPGFVLVDTGGVLLNDAGASALLAPAEAAFHAAAARLTAIGGRPAGVFTIDLVPPDAAADANGGIPVYASDPFPAPAGGRDVDLVRDLLEPGEATTVIGIESPVVVLVTLGQIRAEASDGAATNLRVGEAATFSGDIVLTGEGQAPSTFVAAVIGREAPLPSAVGTPGATPVTERVGSVQLTVYACPLLVGIDEASPGRCLRDPEAVALQLAAIEGDAVRDVGPSTERQGLPTWSGLPGGEYVLRATGFKEGFGRFFVRALEGVDGRGEAGYTAGQSGGYVIPISADAADYALEVYVFSAAAEATPASGAVPATAAPGATAEASGVPSVIQIETPVPGASPTPTATPRPAPIVTATPRPTRTAIITSTAVAQPSRGSVDVRVFACADSIETFDPANCAQAAGAFEVQLVSEDGEIIGLAEATVGEDGSVTWEDLPLGSYLLQQPLLLPGTATYYVLDLPLADDGSGYVLTIAEDEPVASVDIFGLPPSPAAAAPTAAPAATGADTDADGLLDADETALYGTDPANPDSDLDGIADGAEIAAGTNPLVADAPPVQPAADSDGDRLLDGDEAGFGTDPANPDSDGDGWFDGDEVNLGTAPLDPSSFPAG